MSNWLTKLTKPYVGGPRYDKPRTILYQLENWELSVSYPGGSEHRIEQPKPVNYPFRSPEMKFGIHVDMGSWAFGAPLRIRLMQALGGIFDPLATAVAWIEVRKLLGGKSLDPANPAALGEYIKWEYHDDLETPPVEGRGNGTNYIIRQREAQLLASKGERYRRNHDAALESQLMPHPTNMKQCEIQGLLWAYFTVCRYNRIPTACYAIPLDRECYLYVEFRGTVEACGEKYIDVLVHDMQQIEQWMMPRLRLTEITPSLDAPPTKPLLPPPGSV
jgi:hypothetical protein